MAEEKRPAPRRTREHIIAALSVNYVERFFLDRGHVVVRLAEDYGLDAIVQTFDEEGYRESGDIGLQLKASDAPRFSKDGSFVAVEIDTRHYRAWTSELLPVFLILYHARATRAYWLYVQEYFGSDSRRRPRPGAKSVVIRIPVANEFTTSTVDYARERKASILTRIVRGGEYHD